MMAGARARCKGGRAVHLTKKTLSSHNKREYDPASADWHGKVRAAAKFAAVALVPLLASAGTCPLNKAAGDRHHVL
jgi:hypothetical protein